MASNLERSIRSAAEKLALMLEENATLTIRTYITEVSSDGAVNTVADRVLVAETTIRLDGDYETVIPVQRTDAGALERDEDLLNVHQQNVQAAIVHRDKALTALLDVIK